MRGKLVSKQFEVNRSAKAVRLERHGRLLVRCMTREVFNFPIALLDSGSVVQQRHQQTLERPSERTVSASRWPHLLSTADGRYRISALSVRYRDGEPRLSLPLPR
jgi:hypothetical protein